jgi:hypothetical protein
VDKKKTKSGQHFLLSAKLRDFTFWDVSNLSEAECFWMIVEFRWGSVETVVCPNCGSIGKPYARIDRGQLRCRSIACDHHFSPFHDSPFEDRKMGFKKILLGVVLFVSSPKGVPALHLSRVLDIQNKTATVFTGKLRESLLSQRDMEPLVGIVEIDGGYFCGKPRKGRIRLKTSAADVLANLEAKANGEKAPRRKARNAAEARNWAKRKNKRVIMVLREKHPEDGKGAAKTRIAIGYTENARMAEKVAREFVQDGCVVMTDENAAYIPLAAFHEHKVVKHAEEFSTPDGVNENQTESYFSRVRRAEYGTFHGYRPKYLFDYAQEFAWREDTRRMTLLEMTKDLFTRFFDNGKSKWWRGYWQGHNRADEYCVTS